MTASAHYRKKLIEVALPLDAINRESVRENYIYRGNPSAVHKWWAQRPLAACRAVLFASLVDDPSSHPEKFPTEEGQEKERQRLFRLIEDLVKWENSNNQQVLEAAQAEIRKSTGENPPPVLDPFCGGGSIPLEAQRLGLEAHASDLNPVAVLITKALIEIPPKFAGNSPVHPKDKQLIEREWQGASGLAEDVRYYGQWMRDEAERRIGYLYPKVKVPKEHGGGEARVIAWLWARTVKCPNPACGALMPLVRSFWLSTKKGKQAWVDPVIDKKHKTVRFEVGSGKGSAPEGTVNRRGALCIVCKTPVPFDHVRAEGKAGRMSAQLMAIVAEGRRGRVYVAPTEEHVSVAQKAKPSWIPDTELPEQALGFRVQLYGMTKHADLFTPRQLVTLTTFSELVIEARKRVVADARKAGMTDDGKALTSGGNGGTAYADAVATYLAFACDKLAMYSCALVPWYAKEDRPSTLFGRQTISMVWDFTEVNPFSGIGGSAMKSVLIVADSIASIENRLRGYASQQDAALGLPIRNALVCTDPPYYDNVPYADLSDFFYVWMRRSLGKVYPDLFSTLLTPKNEELVADPFRYGGKDNAEKHFIRGIERAFSRIRQASHSGYPVTIYYAFKQAESDSNGDEASDSAPTVSSTGWETMLKGLLAAGFAITGTWPMRTERAGRLRDTGSNALASSIVLVCRLRPESAPLATRREFVAALKKELPEALKALQHGNVAPVDLAQASIGPGMAVLSQYSKVLEADGTLMSVRTALEIINQELDAYLAAQEGEMDGDTRFCLAWFEQHGMNEGPFGDADVLARAKNTSVQGLGDAGVLSARAGKVRLLKRAEYEKDWDPPEDRRLTVWECTQQLILQLNTKGEEGAALLSTRLGGRSEDARALAYRLYAICERKGWAEEALAYNSLVVSWPAIQERAARVATTGQQSELFQ